MATLPASLPGMPGPSDDTASAMSSLGSMQPPQVQGDPAAAAAQRNQVVMGQIRDLHGMIDGLARQYPAASQEADEVKQALVKFMTKIVGAPPGREVTQNPAVPQG